MEGLACVTAAAAGDAHAWAAWAGTSQRDRDGCPGVASKPQCRRPLHRLHAMASTHSTLRDSSCGVHSCHLLAGFGGDGLLNRCVGTACVCPHRHLHVLPRNRAARAHDGRIGRVLGADNQRGARVLQGWQRTEEDACGCIGQPHASPSGLAGLAASLQPTCPTLLCVLAYTASLHFLIRVEVLAIICFEAILFHSWAGGGGGGAQQRWPAADSGWEQVGKASARKSTLADADLHRLVAAAAPTTPRHLPKPYVTGVSIVTLRVTSVPLVPAVGPDFTVGSACSVTKRQWTAYTSACHQPRCQSRLEVCWWELQRMLAGQARPCGCPPATHRRLSANVLQTLHGARAIGCIDAARSHCCA